MTRTPEQLDEAWAKADVKANHAFGLWRKLETMARDAHLAYEAAVAELEDIEDEEPDSAIAVEREPRVKRVELGGFVVREASAFNGVSVMSPDGRLEAHITNADAAFGPTVHIYGPFKKVYDERTDKS